MGSVRTVKNREEREPDGEKKGNWRDGEIKPEINKQRKGRETSTRITKLESVKRRKKGRHKKWKRKNGK